MFPTPAPPLRGPRLILSRIEAGEAEAVVGYAGLPGFFRFLPEAPPGLEDGYSAAHARDHIRELHALEGRGFPHWGLRLDGTLVGAIRFAPSRDGDRRAELGYGLGPPWWGQGLAGEAVHAVLGWWRGLPGPPPLVARCHRANSASMRVLARAGFREVRPDGAGRRRFFLGIESARGE